MWPDSKSITCKQVSTYLHKQGLGTGTGAALLPTCRRISAEPKSMPLRASSLPRLSRARPSASMSAMGRPWSTGGLRSGPPAAAAAAAPAVSAGAGAAGAKGCAAGGKPAGCWGGAGKPPCQPCCCCGCCGMGAAACCGCCGMSAAACWGAGAGAAAAGAASCGGGGAAAGHGVYCWSCWYDSYCCCSCAYWSYCQLLLALALVLGMLQGSCSSGPWLLGSPAAMLLLLLLHVCCCMSAAACLLLGSSVCCSYCRSRSRSPMATCSLLPLVLVPVLLVLQAPS
jgi:hypothetical protein